MGRCGAALLLIAGTGGCVGPEETRFLSLQERDPRVESRSYDYHDPFPDKHVGPDTYSRPRAFIDPRDDTRKTLDVRFLQAMHPTAGQPQYAGVPPVVRGPARPGPGGVPIPTSPPVATPYPVATQPFIQPTVSSNPPFTGAY